LKTTFARNFDGQAAEVLVESAREPRSGALRGYTRNYLRTTLDGPDAWMGHRIDVRLAVSDDGRVTSRAAA
jgi:tRNA A37 methylthiotransferase MiaB